MNATLYEATEERIIVLMKNEQLAIAKDDIDQLDARPPAKKGLKPTVQSTATPTTPDYTPKPYNTVPVPGTDYGSTVGFGGSKPDFETVYRRVASASQRIPETTKTMPPETGAPAASPK